MSLAFGGGDNGFAVEHRTTSCKRMKKLTDGASVAAPRCIHKGTSLSSWDISRLRRENTANVLKEKKLILVLDLDNTLLHSVKDSNLSSEDEHLIRLRELVEDDRDRSVFRWSGVVTKLRPRVRAFLKEASTMYDMHVYTMGSREYALRVAEFLDPEGVYFKNKVLSREDCTAPNQKGLDVVLGEERAVVIVDDNRTVWRRHARNQIEIKMYHFFGPRRPLFDFDGNPLSDIEELESKYSTLDDTLGYLKRIHSLFFHRAPYRGNSDGDVRRILPRIVSLRKCSKNNVWT